MIGHLKVELNKVQPKIDTIKSKLEKLVAKEKRYLMDKSKEFEENIIRHVEANKDKIEVVYSDLSSRIVAISSKFRISMEKMESVEMFTKKSILEIETKMFKELDTRIEGIGEDVCVPVMGTDKGDWSDWNN